MLITFDNTNISIQVFRANSPRPGTYEDRDQAARPNGQAIEFDEAHLSNTSNSLKW